MASFAFSEIHFYSKLKKFEIVSVFGNTAHLKNYIVETLNTHTRYFLKYIISEVLHLANVILQLYLINLFSDSMFIENGYKVFLWALKDAEDRSDPLIQLFPRLVKCDLQIHGPSGTLQREDAMCVMNINNLNEKMFAISFIWFLFVALASFLQLLHLFTIFMVPSLRFSMFIPKKYSVRGWRAAGRWVEGGISVHNLSRYSDMGDWFLINLISKNVHQKLFLEVLADLENYFKDEGKSA